MLANQYNLIRTGCNNDKRDESFGYKGRVYFFNRDFDVGIGISRNLWYVLHQMGERMF